MSQEIVKVDENKAISLENLNYLKEEFQDEYYSDDKISVTETTITNTVNISNSELNGHIRNDDIKTYEKLSVDHIKADLPSSELEDRVSNNMKTEGGIRLADIQIKCLNELLYCSHCHKVCQDYCTKCGVLVHILNKIPSHNTYNRVGELPKYVLETRELSGHLGIFCLKVIPENVRFGPFTGLNSTGVSLRIKEGRFVVNDDKSEHLNWMQYINAARNIHEQNLFPFQYEDKLYYYSTRRIEEGEELLVYFGEEYEDSLLRNVEMDFVPITKKDVENVFACTFCCLGFSSKKYLAEHKAACHGETNDMFSVKELAQCPFCKIYLEAMEYFEHHRNYCCETNARCFVKRDCALPSAKVHDLEIERRSPLRNKAESWKRGIYKCTSCKHRTMYNADNVYHTNEHYEVRMSKCGICRKRNKARESLKAHVGKIHADNEETIQLKVSDYTCAECEFKTNFKSDLVRHVKTIHLKEQDYKCTECEFKANFKSCLKAHIKTIHLKVSDYKCAECEYMTNYKSALVRHVKTIHLKEHDYKCAECEYLTNNKSRLEVHIKTKHLKKHDYKCTECEFKTNNRSNLEAHVKTKHLKEHDYKCAECEFKTNGKAYLKAHVKTKHLKEHDYKCAECEYVTNYKTALVRHVKTIHLQVSNYKCAECEYRTNCKSYLRAHVKTKHLKEHDYKCAECKYKTNNKSHLERHLKTIHLKISDYKCVVCEYKTSHKSCLEQHMKTVHLKINDYKCTACEYKTNYKSSLEKHLKTKHFKEGDYKCMKCEFKTFYKLSLERHVKTKHLKE